MRRALLAVLLMLVALPAPAAPIIVTDAPRLDLADEVEWCEAPARLDVNAIAAGQCGFSPASADILKRGVIRKAIWLRLTLSNPAPSHVDRWLQVGHPRLTHVGFFERHAADWRQNETGMAVPIAKRQVRAIDPILALTLAPLEQRSILVRVESLSAVDAHPTLWRPDQYQFMSQNKAMTSGFGIGALFATALFILAIYFLWNTRAYLYLALFVLSIIGFSMSHSGLLQFYLWPADWPFDLRIQAVAGVGIGVFFAFFVCDLVDARTHYRRHYVVIMVMTSVTLLATAWTCLVDYRAAALLTVFLVLATTAVSALLLLRRRLAIPDGARIPLIIIGVFILARTIMMGLGATHGIAADNFLIRHGWVFLMTCLPAALIGLIIHKRRMQMQLQASQAESAARVNFLARMSHELRTPLDIIIGTAQLLSQPAHRARFQEGLTDISANGRQLLKMIDEVLDYSRGVIGKLTIKTEAVNWPEFLRSVERDAKVLAARNRNIVSLMVSGEALTGIRIDEKRLKQILDNLVTNAARHTEGGWIRLECATGPAGPDGRRQLNFAVSDSGDGILPEDLERIFQPFERGRNAAQHGGKGVGMGLAISRQLVELMGGSLTVESKPGRGASFRFHVMAEPAGAAEAKSSLLESIRGYAGPRRTVLVADDESGNRTILATMLREAGFSVLEVESGGAAVACCAEVHVDVVLTDQFMAEGDGWFVLRHLAEQRSELPVILISAAPPDRPAGMPDGLDFAKALMKPLNHSEVLRCIGDLLGLAWIEAPRAPPVSAASECRPGEADLQDLREMIEAGRVSDIIIWAAEITARDRRYAGFAERAHDAALDLNFEALKALAS